MIKKVYKRKIGISLHPKIIKLLDEKRGSISRSAYIENLLREDLGVKKL